MSTKAFKISSIQFTGSTLHPDMALWLGKFNKTVESRPLIIGTETDLVQYITPILPYSLLEALGYGRSLFSVRAYFQDIDLNRCRVYPDQWLLSLDVPLTYEEGDPLPETRYTEDNQHPMHPFVDWQYEVECGYTESGYHDWVLHQLFMEQPDDE